MKVFGLFVLTAGSLLVGCNAKLTVQEISAETPSGAKIDGIPFRSKKTAGATVWQLQPDKTYKEVGAEPIVLTIADPSHLYVLGYQGSALSDATLDVALANDNTLTKVNLASTSHANDAIANTATAAQDVSTQSQTNKTAKITKANAQQTALLAADSAHAAAEEALLAYQVAQQDTTTTATDLLAKKDAARSAQLAANEAARLAGLPPYYAGISPYAN